MPFIWNDDNMKFINEDEFYDQTQFVIVRKLFMEFCKEAKVDSEWLIKTFGKFGPIENAGVFQEKDTRMAYVTFGNDLSAYNACTATDLHEIMRIMPADTWRQPTLPHPIYSDNKALEALQIYKEALKNQRATQSELSILFRDVIIYADSTDTKTVQDEVYANCTALKTFTFKLGDVKSGLCMSLKDVRTILLYIGRNLSDLRIVFSQEKWPTNLRRYLEKMCQYVGKYLTNMRITYPPPKHEFFTQIEPLLCRIETLHLQLVNYDFDFDIDFQSLCPTLTTLNISMNIKGEFLTKPWPKLKQLAMLNNQYMEEKLVFQMIKNNPQFIYLKIEANDCNNLLLNIQKCLPNLQKLCLYQAYPNITCKNLVYLTEMKHLKKLKLMNLDCDDFNNILICLTQFKQLTELKLHLFFDGIDSPDVNSDDLFAPNFSSILALGQQLQHLESFHLRYCQIDTETFMNFIKSATQLQCIGIYRCGFEITNTIIDSIACIRKTINPSSLMLLADKINKEVHLSTEHLVQNISNLVNVRELR